MHTLNVHDPRQLRALTSPRRQEIVLVLERLGEASIKEVAVEMNVAPDALYYHIRMLEKVGLVLKSSKRQAVTRAEQAYRLPARKLNIAYDTADHESGKLLYDAVATTLRESARQARRAISEGYIDPGKRDLQAHRASVVLTRKAYAEVRRHMRAIQELVDSQKTNRRGKRYAITQLICPLDP
jgi:predicted ArsR family transcriptional regulator